MKSTPFHGVQVTQEMQQLLECRGYELTCRGSVNVKGKGSMITYFLKGKAELPAPPEQPAPTVAMEQETAKEAPAETTPEAPPAIEATAAVEAQPHQEEEDNNDDDEDDDIDLNSNMQNLTAQRRKSLCRQHNISSSFGTNVSSTGITPSISNSSSVVTIGALPALMRNVESCATPTVPPRTLVAELKEEITRDEKSALKDSIENLEILLKNNISLSDLSNKQQQNLRGEVVSCSSSATATLRKRDTIVSFHVTETLTTTAAFTQQQRKRRSVSAMATSCTTSSSSTTTTTRLLSNESQSSTHTAPGTLESGGKAAECLRAGLDTDPFPDADTEAGQGQSHDWQPRTASLEPNRSPIKTSQSMSPIGLATEVFVLPNSRSMILISSTGSGSASGSQGGSSPRAGLLQQVST